MHLAVKGIFMLANYRVDGDQKRNSPVLVLSPVPVSHWGARKDWLD